jgi:hypothetical protein
MRGLRVSYEDLVEDLSASESQILVDCGLKFGPACVAFYSNRRAITPPTRNGRASRSCARDFPSGGTNNPLREALGDASVRYRLAVARGVEIATCLFRGIQDRHLSFTRLSRKRYRTTFIS